jgi:uncharacterized protein YndB with AHSA1/START domain
MTAQQTTATAVRRSITVAAPVEKAFEVFTDRFGAWWPLDYHTGDEDPETVVIEPRRGGRWYERTAGGEEADWGVVLAWEPPTRLVLAWRLDAEWKHNPDPAKQTEIEVHFVPDGRVRTRVDLEHRLLDRSAAAPSRCGRPSTPRPAGSDCSGVTRTRSSLPRCPSPSPH